MEPLLSSDPSNVGSYRLLGRLGGGGMGVVYLAEDAERRRVAVKLLSGGPGMGPQLRERLAREARSLQLLSSPHVVRVIEVDVQAEVPFLVMSYAEGLPLDRSVPEGGLAPQWAREFGAQLAGALADVHGHGVVHRDLKPNNVILGASGVTLVDFGIASLEEEGVTALTRDGGFMGSLAWLAPEVIAGASADERSDVFGLGLLLGFMALGRHPYGGGRPEAVMYRIMHERPDLDDVDPTLAAVVSAALRRDPQARPSAAELAAALHAPGEVALARPAARGGRSRNGVRLALAGVVAAAVAGAVVVATTAGGSAAPSAAQTSDRPAAASVNPAVPDTSDFASTCTWSKREPTVDESGMHGPTQFKADCGPGADLSATAEYLPPDPNESVYSYGTVTLEGTVAGAPLQLQMTLLSTGDVDPWEGTFNGAKVSLAVGRDGNGYQVHDASTIGNGAIRAVGPQADLREVTHEVLGGTVVETVLVWDSPSVVTGRYYGDERVTAAQAAAICQLVTVGIPSSGMLSFD